VTRRDRYVLVALAGVALVGAFWFLAIGPKRSELRKLDQDVAKTQRNVETARAESQQYAADRLQFPRTYTTVVRLGKAVPAEADVASLVVQLEAAAERAGVDFRKISLATAGAGSSSSASSATAAPAQPPATSGGSAGATGSSGAQASPGSAQPGAQASGTTGASPPAGGGAAASASSTSTAATTPPAPADALSAATLPIGAEVGAAALPVLKFNLIFQGNFFKIADFVHNVRDLVDRRGRRITVSGRLLTVDAIAFKEGDLGFPQVKVGMSATAYLVPATQGLLAGATPQGPGGATAATPAPASSGTPSVTPPTAVVTP
jgi:hypothetical protein